MPMYYSSMQMSSHFSFQYRTFPHPLCIHSSPFLYRTCLNRTWATSRLVWSQKSKVYYTCRNLTMELVVREVSSLTTTLPRVWIGHLVNQNVQNSEISKTSLSFSFSSSSYFSKAQNNLIVFTITRESVRAHSLSIIINAPTHHNHERHQRREE